MRKAVLYPTVPRVRLAARGKRRTLPNQCMSLAEMFRRFVRREPLPQEKQGTFYEGEYDLEKVAKMDRVEQEEILDELKQATTRAEKYVREKAAKITAEKAEEKRAADALKQQQAPEPSSKGPEGKPA